MITRLIFESFGKTAGNITMAGLAFVIVSIFVVIAIGSKTRSR